MTKRVTVEELREHLDDHLAEVKRGETLTIVDDQQTIATMAPAVAAAHEGVPYPFRSLDFGPPLELAIDPAQLVIEEREHERSGKKHGV
jgi:antitoxin (DNA-binding transcriptional repressor) of toxin-antitoxin stability system